MDILRPQLGDFMKNAGLIGFNKLLDSAGVDITKDGEAAVDDILKLDLAQLYIENFNKEYGSETSIGRAYEKLEQCIRFIKEGGDTGSKDFKDDFKFIADKFTAASVKSGFKSIEHEIDNGDIYTELCEKKIKPEDDKDILLKKLVDLQAFANQSLVKETFYFKGVVYSVINKFWEGKSFLIRSNSQKNMKELFRNDFELPFKDFLKNGASKPTMHCIECGTPISGKTAAAITFLKDMADDLNRKPSAFWNCKPDAYVCPICCMMYALAPLGFKKLGNDFIFINQNSSFNALKAANTPKIKNDEKMTYQQYLNNSVMEMLKENEKLISNIQVITRYGAEDKNKDKDKYKFFVIDKSIMEILSKENVKKNLQKLCESHNIRRDNDTYLKVYDECLSNIMNYRSQYNLINEIIRASIEKPANIWPAARVLKVEAAIEEGESSMKFIQAKIYNAGEAGDNLAMKMVSVKTGKIGTAAIALRDEITRGMVYQLTNALKVRNVSKFMDIILRAYSSCKMDIPTVFMDAIKNEEEFLRIGYAFTLGVKGAHYKKSEETNIKEEEQNND